MLGRTYTHRASVDLIYIDPPYNTGKENDFRYNDRFVGEDDNFRHSKWLSFMALRIGEQEFDTPSGAAAHLRDGETNGWDFWGVKSSDGTVRKLSSLRAAVGDDG